MELLFFVWVAMVFVNAKIAHEKGRDTQAAIVGSLFAAPIVFLYLLAVPALPRR